MLGLRCLGLLNKRREMDRYLNLPEYEDLLKRKLFTRKELREIINQRYNFEINLKMDPATSNTEVYKKYIEFESTFDNLRLLRKKRRKDSKTNSISDYASTKKIISIYSRGCKKFPKDIDFWFDFIHYLKSKNYSKLIGKTYGMMLRLHPINTSVWISAANWEFTSCDNIKSARSIMQRGLRVFKNNSIHDTSTKSIYISFFKLELLYIDQIIKKIKDLTTTDLLAEKINITKKVPLYIYSCAIKSFPNDLKFRNEFLKSSRSYITKEVRESILNDFIKFPEAINMIALSYVSSSDYIFTIVNEIKAIEVFENYLLTDTNREIINYFMNHLFNRLIICLESNSSSDKESIKNDICDFLLECCLNVFYRAIKTKMLSENICEKILNSLLLGGKIEIFRKSLSDMKEYYGDDRFERFLDGLD